MSRRNKFSYILTLPRVEAKLGTRAGVDNSIEKCFIEVKVIFGPDGKRYSWRERKAGVGEVKRELNV